MTAGLEGTRLGKYDVREEIGQGGMSVVYRATDAKLQRDVAVKVMHSFLAEQEDARERFHREAVAVARLHHPHIIEIFDYSGEDAETAFIVTELVAGRALSEVLKDVTIQPPEAALVLARPIVDALVHAHEQGIIHRDLKPENILVAPDGTLKLTDFGIARMLDTNTLTVTGTLLGSPAYMAPEYIEGYATDARADIFSFGAMFYQFAVGKLPFEGSSAHALLKKIATGDFMPPDQRNPQVHAGIARIIRRCLARLPEHRYDSSRELLADIDALLDEIGLDWRDGLRKLLGQPHDYAAELVNGLGARYVELGKAALNAGRTGVALEHFDRVLTIDPTHKEVRRILDRLARRAWVWRGLRAAALGVGGAALFTLILGSLISMWNHLEMERQAEAMREAAAAAAAARPPPSNEPERPDARDLTVLVTGTGNLYLDDELKAEGLTGAKSLPVMPGVHRLRLVGAEKTAERTVEVLEDGDIEPVALDVYVAPKAAPPPPAKKRVVEFNAPRWVDVYLDGQPVREKQMGLFELELTYGEHELRFVNPWGEPLKKTIEVGDDSPPGRINVALTPRPAHLLFEGGPEVLNVYVNGKFKQQVNDLNRTDKIIVPLNLGPLDESETHDVKVTGADGKTVLYEERVAFKANETKTIPLRDGAL